MATTVSSDSAALQSQARQWDAVLAGLDSNDLQRVKEAIDQARRHRDEAVAALIEELGKRAADARQGRIAAGSLPQVALCLLTEFRATEALPVIVEILTLPGELPERLLDDALNEVMPRTLATLAGDQLVLLDGVIRDPKVNEYSRWAAINVRGYLVRDGRLSQAEGVQALQRHLRDAIDRLDGAIGTPLVLDLTALGGRNAYDTIVEAFKAGIVDTSMIDLAEAEEEFAETGFKDRSLKHLRPTGIDDTTAEIETWHWPGAVASSDDDEEAGLPPGEKSPTLLEMARFSAQPEQLFLGDVAPDSTVRHEGHVGRNEPCPCGSGKKFKKCCGKPGA